jgi:hypothetical protein
MTGSASPDFVPAAALPPAAKVTAARSPTIDGRPPVLREARRPPRDAPAALRTETTSWIGGTPEIVSLLDVEPDLGRGIEPQDWELARQATRTTVTRIDRREWALPVGASDNGTVIGLIVNDGLISREIALGEHVEFDLLTPGDVLLPPPRSLASRT